MNCLDQSFGGLISGGFLALWEVFLWVVQRIFVCLFGSSPVSVVVAEWAPCVGHAHGVLGPGAGCMIMV